jgi:methenyltetrahydromethanopterin cyclohydrolase
MGLFQDILLIARTVDAVHQRALETEAVLDRIQQKMENIIMAEKTVAELLAEVDTATTGVANRIQGLLDQLNAPNPTADELAAAKAGLQAEVDRLTAMGTGSTVDPNP